eukprot:2005293-Rhodomonas_salina.5
MDQVQFLIFLRQRRETFVTDLVCGSARTTSLPRCSSHAKTGMTRLLRYAISTTWALADGWYWHSVCCGTELASFWVRAA